MIWGVYNTIYSASYPLTLQGTACSCSCEQQLSDLIKVVADLSNRIAEITTFVNCLSDTATKVDCIYAFLKQSRASQSSKGADLPAVLSVDPSSVNLVKEEDDSRLISVSIL